MCVRVSENNINCSITNKYDFKWQYRQQYDKNIMTIDTSHAVRRRPGQILERHDLAEDSTRQAILETAYGGGLRPTTGHYGCPMMMTFQMCVARIKILIVNVALHI